jgi:hypothetical protein
MEFAGQRNPIPKKSALVGRSKTTVSGRLHYYCTVQFTVNLLGRGGRHLPRGCFKTIKAPVLYYSSKPMCYENGDGVAPNFREKGRLALLVDSCCAPALGLAACTKGAFLSSAPQQDESLPYRPLRVCSVVAPSHPTFLAKTGAILFLKQPLTTWILSPSRQPVRNTENIGDCYCWFK